MVEPIVLGIVIGLVCISVAGLFVAAVGNWALSARLNLFLVVVGFSVAHQLSMGLTSLSARAFPAFAQQLYEFPIDATGKAA